MALAEIPSIAVWGGGRWGSVLVEKTAELLPTSVPILWVSRRDPEQRRRLLRTRGLEDRIGLCAEREESLARSVAAVVIATAPADHAAHVRMALQAGCHVMVEKPLAFDPAEAEDLVRLAQARELVLAIDLVFLTAPFLQRFAALVAPHWPIKRVSVVWADPAEEVRHHDLKRADLKTPIAFDIFPHVWSVLRVVAGKVHPRIETAEMSPNGSLALRGVLECTSRADLQFAAVLDRNAWSRQRWIEVVTCDGTRLALDFSREPGNLYTGAGATGTPLPPGPSPLGTALGAFLDAVAHTQARPSPLSAAKNLGSVSAAATAHHRIQEATLRALRNGNVTGPRLDAVVTAWLVGAIGARDAIAARAAEAQTADWLPRLRRALPSIFTQSADPLSAALRTVDPRVRDRTALATPGPNAGERSDRHTD